MATYANPGSISFQVGATLADIRGAIVDHDPDLIDDLTGFLFTLVAPFVEDADEERFLAAKPDLEGEGEWEREGRLFDASMVRLRLLLRLLAKNNLYAWTQDPIGDATGIALTDDQDEDQA